MSMRAHWILPALALGALVLCQQTGAQPPPATSKLGPPLSSLDGKSELGGLKSPPIADPKGDAAAAGQIRVEEPPRSPPDPKVLR